MNHLLEDLDVGLQQGYYDTGMENMTLLTSYLNVVLCIRSILCSRFHIQTLLTSYLNVLLCIISILCFRFHIQIYIEKRSKKANPSWGGGFGSRWSTFQQNYLHRLDCLGCSLKTYSKRINTYGHTNKKNTVFRDPSSPDLPLVATEHPAVTSVISALFEGFYNGGPREKIF